MSSDRELINNNEREMVIQSNSLVFHQKDEYCSSANLNMPKYQSYARGKCIKMHFARVGCPLNSSSLVYKHVHNSKTLDECISCPIMISPKEECSTARGIESISFSNGEQSSLVVEMNQQQSNHEESGSLHSSLKEECSTARGIESISFSNGEQSSLVVEMNQQQSNHEELVYHNDEGHVSLASLSRDLTNSLNNNQHIVCRSVIENEIGKMIEGVLALRDDGDEEPLYIADCYCHFDILFEKLKNSKQTVYQYLQHNSSIYTKGIDMVYIIQSFFAPHHIKYENWNNEYKNYLDHPCVYATCGISPLFSHHYDMNMELDLRRTLNHPKVIAVGEIGLDFETRSRPDDYVQIAAFIKQLRIAKEKNLPVVLISRNSFIQTLQCISDELDSDHRIHWRNFSYSKEELEMLHSRMHMIFFGCSPQVLYNKKLQMNIEKASIDVLLPESAAPHMTVEQCPRLWNTHPIFAIQVYRLISHLFQLPIRKTVDKLVDNIIYFYHLK